MATFLKQSTAVDIGLGPFVDSADGVTAETGLTISQADVRLKKNAGSWAQKNDTNAATHEENGWYECALNTTDTDTLGILLVAVAESGALPVWREFQVLPANVYDSLVAGSDALQVHANEITNGLITAAAIATDAIDADAIADGAITSGVFAAGAITAAAIAADAIGASELAADAVAEIQSGLSTLDAAGVRSAIGLASANLDTQLDALPTAAEIADAVWDEDATGHQTQGTFGQAIGDPTSDSDTIWALVNTNLNATISSRASQTSLDTLDDYVDTEVATILSRLGTPSDLGSGATVAANLVDIEAQTDDIGAAGAGLSAVPWNAAWDADVQSEVQDAIEANNLDHIAGTATGIPAVVSGTYLDQIMDDGTATYDRTTDSLQAIRDRGDAAWDTADVSALALQSSVDDLEGRLTAQRAANLDSLDATISSRASQTSVNTIDDLLDTEIAAIISTLGAPAGVSVSADLADIEGKVDDLESRLTAARAGYLDNLSGGAVALASGVALTSAGIDAIFDRSNGVETGYTLRHALRLMAAALLGELSGAATTTITIRDMGDTKTRITATVDSDGNRTALSLDAS